MPEAAKPKKTAQPLQKDLEERLQLDRAYIKVQTKTYSSIFWSSKEALAKKQITIEEAAQKEFEARKKALAKMAVVKAQLANETQLTVEQQNDLVLQAQKLNTELAELEEAQTAKVIEEGEKQKEQRKKNIEFALNTASDVLDAAQSLSDAVLAMEEKPITKTVGHSQSKHSKFGGKFGKSKTGRSGLYTTANWQRNNRSAPEFERAQTTSPRKRAAIANKAFAVAQAGINVALGVTTAFDFASTCFLHYHRFNHPY